MNVMIPEMGLSLRDPGRIDQRLSGWSGESPTWTATPGRKEAAGVGYPQTASSRAPGRRTSPNSFSAYCEFGGKPFGYDVLAERVGHEELGSSDFDSVTDIYVTNVRS